MKHLHFYMLLLLLFLAGQARCQDTIAVLLNPALPGLKIADDYAGLSFEKNSLNPSRAYFTPHKDTLLRFFRTLGLKNFRIGGNSVDKDTLGGSATSTHFTKAELDSLFGFMQLAGCKVMMGLNFGGDFNPSLAATEAAYVSQNYPSVLWGFEVGNEPDLYHSNGFRPSTYTVAGYESQFKLYYDTIRQHVPGAVFTGPTSATNYTSFTLPFCRAMHGKISLLTQHYYVGAANSAPVHKQIVTLLSAAKLNSVVAEVNALVQCADSAGIPFRMGECNSFYNGGQWGASDAFASALWALDYMYALAEKGCGGVNFHGALGGPYTVISRHNNVYTARPLYYGILAFQAGSKGAFIPETITNNHINLNVYSVIDSLQNLYVTLVNKDTLQNAVVDLDAGSAIYTTGEYIALSAPALGDTVNTSLGGQTVDAKGNCAPYSWLVVPVTSNKIRVKVGAGSALIVRLNKGFASGMNVIENNTKNYRVYPNPATSSISVHCDEVLQEPVVIEVYDTKGCRVLRTEMEGQERTLDISFLPEGTYQVRISSNSKMLFQTPVIKAK